MSDTSILPCVCKHPETLSNGRVAYAGARQILDTKFDPTVTTVAAGNLIKGLFRCCLKLIRGSMKNSSRPHRGDPHSPACLEQRLELPGA